MPVLTLASATICFSRFSQKSRFSWQNLSTLITTKMRENFSRVSYPQNKGRVKKSKQFVNQVKSCARLKFRKIAVFVSKWVTIRALASARGSVATRRVATGPRARGQRARPLEGPKGPRVAKTCESEGPKGPRTSKAKCPSRCLPVLLYVFHNSAQNREIQGPFSRP